MNKYRLIIALLILMLGISCKPKNIRLNTEASLYSEDQLPENPLLLHPFTTTIHPKENLMCTLYGNNAAFDYALKHANAQYPEGSILYEVTWREQPDSQWFGANIPKKIVQVERIQFQNNQQIYSKYAGTPLKAVKDEIDSQKARFILNQRIAMVP